MKQNKIKGGIYSGWWSDFYTGKQAKHYGHRQNRAKGRQECKRAIKNS